MTAIRTYIHADDMTDAVGVHSLDHFTLQVPDLRQAMRSDTAQVRRVAIGAIALIADRSGEEALTEAIRNPNDDNESRECVAEASCSRRSSRHLTGRRRARASDAINARLKPSRTPPEGIVPTRSSIRQFGNAAAVTAPSNTAIHEMYIHNRKIGMMASAPYTV